MSHNNTLIQKQSKFFAAPLYTCAALLPFEEEHIFRQTWIYIGHADELMQAGNVKSIAVSGSRILITRGSDDQLRAFHNVCPHRAALFCPEVKSYQLKRLVCPYHAWTYNLEGNLVGVPQEERFQANFCRTDYPLRPVRLEQWQNFVFLCLSDTAPPLHEFLGQIPAVLKSHFTSKTTLLIQKQYPVHCNWKVYHDNTLCDYHVAIAHRTTLNSIQGPVNHYQHEFDSFVNLLYTPTTAHWQQHHSVLETLDDHRRQGFFTFGIFPNLHLLALPNGLIAWIRIDPVTVDTSTIHLEIYGIPEFSPPDEVLKDFEDFMAEDMAISEGVQKGYATNAYHPGPANQLEDRITHQQHLIWEFLQIGLQRDRSNIPLDVKAILSSH